MMQWLFEKVKVNEATTRGLKVFVKTTQLLKTLTLQCKQLLSVIGANQPPADDNARQEMENS